MSHPMDNYHQLMSNTMERGVNQFNRRTGLNCKVLVGDQVQFDLHDGFSAVTSKKLAFKNSKGELLGFFRGYDNAADFRALGCNVWDQNANETQAWLDNPARKGTDDLGRIYGVQWTRLADRRIAHSDAECDALMARGYKIEVDGRGTYAMVRYINQLENALRTLITNPSDRRVIVSAWNVAELDLMSLPPCHMDYRFVAFEDPRELHVVMTIRSWDEFLGAPFNICNTALFLAIMARLANFEPRTVTIQATNAHIYENHFEQVQEQLSRDHMALPKLVLSDNIRPVTLDQVEGAFERIQPDDIQLEGYESHAAIKAPMAA